MTLTSKLITRPSSAHRWFNCPGSATLEAQIPDTESSMYALEGSAAHGLCRYFAMLSATEHDISQLIGSKVGRLIPASAFNPADFTYPIDIKTIRDTLMDPQMASAVWMYCKYVYDLLDGISPLNRDYVRFEEKVKTLFGVEGTSDCIVLDWPTELHVIDFKYGAGISVDVEENLQLLIYALGALQIENDFDKVTLTIVQPRDKFGNFIKKWTITQQELTSKWYPKIKKAHDTCINKPDKFKIGSWCKWCKGAELCPKATRTARNIVKSSKGLKVPAEVKKLSQLLQSESAVLDYLNRAKLEAFNRLQRGERIPGYKLVQSFGNTKWKDNAEEYIKTFAWDHRIYTEKLMTPNQAKEKLKTIDVNTEWIDEHTHRPLKGLVLVPDTDRRIEYTSAKQDFEDE